MTSRPAAPESLVKRLCAWVDADGADPLHLEAAAEIERLERRLSLAQTEIKGHMRTEDELKRDIAIYQASIEKFAMQHQRKVMGLEARIAELEKVLIQVREEWYGYTPYSKLKQDIDAALQDKIDK